MNFEQVQYVLNNLPLTFQREGTPYTQWIDADTAGLFRYTQAADGVTSQAFFPNAQYGWLDFWGLLFGIPRNAGEADQKYFYRISYTINTGAGTPEAITLWIQNIFGISVEVEENFPEAGYSIVFPSTVTLAQVDTILQTLIYVRPAGVPITSVNVTNASIYLDTINYLETSRGEGSYLSAPSGGQSFSISSTTNNSSPLLPDLYLTDPLLNPS